MSTAEGKETSRKEAGDWVDDSPHGSNLTGEDILEMGPPPKHGGTVDLAEAAARRTRAVTLRLAGLSYREIAERVGYSHEKSAQRAVLRSLDRIEVANVRELREIENARLDTAQAAIWSKVVKGDMEAVNTFLRLSNRRAKMNGLDAPQQVNVSTSIRTELETALSELHEVIEAEVLSDVPAEPDDPEAS